MKELLLAAFNAELKRRKISHAEIAERLCISRGTVGKWLNKGTSLKNMDEIAAAFGFRIDKITFK